VEDLVDGDGVELDRGTGQGQGQPLADEAGAHPDPEQAAVPVPTGRLEQGRTVVAVRLRIVLPRGGDDVLPAPQQAADVVIVGAVGHLQPGGVDHHVRVQGQDLVDVLGRDHAGLGPPGQGSGVHTGLAVAVDVQPDQLAVRRIDDRTQARLAHRAGRPTNHPVGHRPAPGVRPVDRAPECRVFAAPASQRTGSRAYLALASTAIRSVSVIRSPRAMARSPAAAMSPGFSLAPSTWSAIRVSTEPTTSAVTLMSCGANSARAMTDRNS